MAENRPITPAGLAIRSSREQSHDKKSSGPAGPDNRELKDPMGDTGHWREKVAATYSLELTAVEARLNGVEFAEPADQDGSLHQKNSETEEQEQSGRAKWWQQSSPDGDARFVRDTAAEGPEPRTLLPSHALSFHAFYLAQLLVLVFIRCQQNKRERGQKVIASAKKVAFTLKLRLIHHPRQTVRYMVKHQRESSSCMLFSVVKLINKSLSRTFCFSWSVFLELESPLTSMPTGHCLSIRGCSQELSEQIL
ncbi:conserved hypothetical protein [Trichinella spiralis]|nr:conserved hypothetical protein [Trichinella spiralis]